MLNILLVLLACSGNKDDGDSGDTLEVSNVGPSGASVSENSCAPNDGWALRINVGLEQSECEAELPDDFWMRFEVFPDELVSGAEIVLGNLGVVEGFGLFHYSGEVRNVGSGSISLEFEGDWTEGSEFTGYYAVELEDGLVLEGGFTGVHCGGETMCG